MHKVIFASAALVLLVTPQGATAKSFGGVGMHNTGQTVRATFRKPGSKLRVNAHVTIIKSSFAASHVTQKGDAESLAYFLVSTTPYAKPGRRLHVSAHQRIELRESEPSTWVAKITYAGKSSEGKGHVTERVILDESSQGELLATFSRREGRASGEGFYDPRTGKASVTFGGTRDTVVRQRHVIPFELAKELPRSEVIRALQDKLSHELYSHHPLSAGF